MSTEIIEYDDAADLAVSEDRIRQAIAHMNAGGVSEDIFSTYGDGEADEVWFALAESVPVAKNLDTVLDIVGFVVLRVELKNERTGQLEPNARISFVAADGTAYNVTSEVVRRDVELATALKGFPSEDAPWHVQFVQGGSGNRKFITMKPVRAAK